METGELEAARGQPLGRRCRARPAKRARRAEADIIEQDNEHVGRPSRRKQRLNRREPRRWILRVKWKRSPERPVRDRQVVACDLVSHRALLTAPATPAP